MREAWAAMQGAWGGAAERGWDGSGEDSSRASGGTVASRGWMPVWIGRTHRGGSRTLALALHYVQLSGAGAAHASLHASTVLLLLMILLMLMICVQIADEMEEENRRHNAPYMVDPYPGQGQPGAGRPGQPAAPQQR